MKDLTKFIVEAKISTYASIGESKEKIFKDGCRELIYKKGDFRYRDRYFGFNPFIGEEVVWQNKNVIWAMNYYGKIISDIIPSNRVYIFLQEALRRIQRESPFRGPQEFNKRDFRYVNKHRGTIEIFKGVEIIFYNGQKIYKLNYHGGLVAEKKI